MDIDKLMERSWYKSILNLTAMFNVELKMPVRQIQYRWALIKDHDGIKATYFVNQLKKFDDDIKSLQYMNLIDKNCVTSNSNLSNFLNRLVENELLESKNINGVIYYKITEKAQKYFFKKIIIDDINVMPINILQKIATGLINNELDLLTQGFKKFKDKEFIYKSKNYEKWKKLVED